MRERTEKIRRVPAGLSPVLGSSTALRSEAVRPSGPVMVIAPSLVLLIVCDAASAGVNDPGHEERRGTHDNIVQPTAFAECRPVTCARPARSLNEYITM